MKNENHDLKHDQAILDDLEDNLHSAQYALDKATGDRLKLENDFKIQVDNDAITVNRLKNEGIDLKHILADRNEEIARLRSTLSNLKYTVDLKRGDLNHLKEEFHVNKQDNDHLKAVANGLNSDIKVEVELNNGLKRDLDGLTARIKQLEKDLHNHHHRIDELEDLNNASRKHQDCLHRDIDELERRIRDIIAQLNILEGKARGLKIDMEHLDATIADLKAKLDAEVAFYNNLRADLDRELKIGADLKSAHKRLVETIEARRCELDDLRHEADDLDCKIREVSGINADLEYQIAELTRHIDVLTKQNANLNIELDEILMKDRQVREELHKRDQLADKQRANEENLKKSLSGLSLHGRRLEGSPTLASSIRR